MVKEEPEEKRNDSDVGLFMSRNVYMLQNTVYYVTQYSNKVMRLVIH